MVLSSSIERISAMPDNKDEDSPNDLLVLTAVFAGSLTLANMLFDYYIPINLPLVSISLPLVPALTALIILLAISSFYFYIRYDIIVGRTRFRYHNSNTDIRGVIYLIPGVTKPHNEYLKQLEKED